MPWRSMRDYFFLSPAVELLMEIPSCTAESFILHPLKCSALILRRWLQQIACRKRSPSLFCYHFFFFTFFFFSFFTFLFSLGISKCTTLCNITGEVTHCPLKRGEEC